MLKINRDIHALSIFLAVLLSGCRISENFHEVHQGQYYRSAQLTARELKEAIEKYQIKTIINLRGVNPNEDWYKEEVETAKQYGVEHVSISMSASRLPHKRDLVALLDAFKNSQRPILVHCKQGADRTGEATAIYQIEYMGFTKEKALESLSPKYYHFEGLFPAKKYFVRIYQGQKWAYEEYDPCKTQYKYYEQEKYCQPNDDNQLTVESEGDT